MAAKQKLQFFAYQGVTANGAKVSGEVTASSIVGARQQLAARRIAVKSLKSKSSRKVKVTPFDIALITRQLQTMMDAGVPLVQSYDLIAGGHPNPGARALAMEIKQSLSEGHSLAASLAKFPEYFDDLYVSLIDAGERSGALAKLLDRLAIYKEKTEALRAKIKKAITYPIVIVVFGLGISTGLLMFVVPTFTELFEGFGADLPFLTQIFVDLSNLLKEHGIVVLFGAVAGGFAVRTMYLKSPGVQNAVDKLVLKLPLFGSIAKYSIVARFSRTTSTMFSAGVSLLECLDSTIKVAGNVVYADSFKEVKRNVANGEPLFQALSRSPDLYPSMAVQMIQIGEETGALEDMLGRIATFYEDDVDSLVDNMTSLMEPMIMAFLGVMIGSLVIAMYLPIFQLGTVI